MCIHHVGSLIGFTAACVFGWPEGGGGGGGGSGGGGGGGAARCLERRVIEG